MDRSAETRARRPPGASALSLPPGDWVTVLDCLCSSFPAIDRAQWLDRFARGRVLDAAGRPLMADAPYRAHLRVQYFREVADETPIPFHEQILHLDDDLLVADKPHFLPVVPAGRYVEQTLLRRLMRTTGNPHLVPLHRIDRDTAGLVLFSVNPQTRGAYQALFREQRIDKHYRAVAPRLQPVPAQRLSHIVRGEPFFRMCEKDGPANAETRIACVATGADRAGYELQPVSGRKHQLRVHMAALGAPILGDPLYPDVRADLDAHDRPPMQLLAASLAFVDPLSGRPRCFESGRRLRDWPL